MDLSKLLPWFISHPKCWHLLANTRCSIKKAQAQLYVQLLAIWTAWKEQSLLGWTHWKLQKADIKALRSIKGWKLIFIMVLLQFLFLAVLILVIPRPEILFHVRQPRSQFPVFLTYQQACQYISQLRDQRGVGMYPLAHKFRKYNWRDSPQWDPIKGRPSTKVLPTFQRGCSTNCLKIFNSNWLPNIYVRIL